MPNTTLSFLDTKHALVESSRVVYEQPVTVSLPM